MLVYQIVVHLAVALVVLYPEISRGAASLEKAHMDQLTDIVLQSNLLPD